MGIAGFEPILLVGLDAIRREYGARLAALVGRCMSGYVVVRFVENGDWFADCPIVLDFDGIKAEICHWKFDELSIGWNTVDTTAAISGWECHDLIPGWSRLDERLGPFVGRELREVALLEWRPSSLDLADGTSRWSSLSMRVASTLPTVSTRTASPSVRPIQITSAIDWPEPC